VFNFERPPEAFYLLRKVARLGASIDIGADGQLQVEPEAAVPNDLREKIFASMPCEDFRKFSGLSRSWWKSLRKRMRLGPNTSFSRSMEGM
jgi:hypothetical protein